MGVHVHRSERTDALLLGLADLLREIPADPFTPDVVAVPSPGIERFITQGLGLLLGAGEGRSDGVCANVEFPSPTSLVNRVISQASGLDPDADPWLPQRAVWPLLAVIDASAVEAWCRPLARYLGLDAAGPATDRSNRRFAVASRITALFASYASQRPGLLQTWSDGQDTDGAGGHVPDDLTWQPRLWRRLRDEIGTPSPAERLEGVCTAVRDDPGIVDLPDRLSVFGPTRLPADHLRVLSALGTHREVHLWLADASPDLWRKVAPGSEPLHRHDDHHADVAVNPLLRSLGRDARELRVRLEQQLPTTTDEYLPAQLTADSVLGHLQRQIRDNQDPWLAGHRLTMAAADRSVQVHACHGQPRQAEVVREVVLGLLQADSTLEPRDILIMCPDLDAFAPLLSAAFSAPDTTAAGSLQLRIADRTPEQSNGVLSGLAALLQLLTGRMEMSAMLDFAAQPPVRTRFGFDDDGLERLETLATQAGVRWGLDAAHRGDFQVPIATGTWSWGLDRLLLGAALSEQGLPQVGGVLPVDDVASGDVDLVGRLAELVTRLQRIREAAGQRHPAAGWVTLLSDAVTDLMDARGVDSWQLPNALGAIAELTENAAGYAEAPLLSLADISWLLDGLLAGRPTRSNFRSGALTVCGLVPMRSVPHRVICLVGMDDAAFPRTTSPDGDDVLARDPLVGERETRSEDRQLLLDAIMAASDHLVITYTGADDRTNQPRPPCVPLAELIDTLESMAMSPEGLSASTRICVTHPLQPFDARNFTAGALGLPTAFSHDLQALAAARAAERPRLPEPAFLGAVLPGMRITELSLRELGRFLTSPAAGFLRTRIGVSLRGDDELPHERIPIALDGLARWQIGERALGLLMRGEMTQKVAAAERARGQLPPGALGTEALTAVGRDASDLTQRVAALRTGTARQVSVNLDLPGGVHLVGTATDVYGQSIVRATYSKSKPAHELRLWPELLALAVVEPASSWRGHMVTKDGGCTLDAPAPDDAKRILIALVALYASGMEHPLPLPANTSLEYAQRRARGLSTSAALRAARAGAWQGRYSPDRELPETVMVWGPDADLSTLLRELPHPGEDWYADETTRFGMLSRHLWDPIIEAKGPR